MTLEIDKLSKKFGDQLVLDNLSLSLKKSSSLVLIGPSGGGKTTLLRILAGLEPADRGQIKVNTHILSQQEKELRLYRSTIGMVFQNYNLFPHLTALENITLPLIQVQKKKKEDAEKQALALLNRFNLKEAANKKPAALSGGQKQRVAICRAVAIKPEILFLDEPTSALDPEYTSEVLDLIFELKNEGVELILVTHEMGFAKEVADHILFLSDHIILEQGSPEMIFKESANPRIKQFLSKVLKHH